MLSDRTNHHSDNDDDTTFVTSKIVHFQRHGQGYHNLIGEMVRELTGQVMIDLDQTDSTLNPFVRPELVDSPLTETGRQECVAQQKQKDSRIQPQRIIVSPLTRALQTAVLSFPDERATVPWTAHEGVREQLGLLTCNQRSNVQHLQEAFSHVDFTLLESDHDAVWQPHERELPRHEVERIYTFLVEYVSTLPEHQVAVVGHSAWLFTMMHAVVECSNDNLKRLFATSETRSMRLEWYRTEDRLGG